MYMKSIESLKRDAYVAPRVNCMTVLQKEQFCGSILTETEVFYEDGEEYGW